MSDKKSESIIPCKICKKQSVYNMQCRCMGTFCKKHWDISKHNCSFDFSKHANEQNTKLLVKVEANKVSNI
jgi:hypothetical protein